MGIPTVDIDFENHWKILWKSMVLINCLVTNILQKKSFVFSRRKKFIPTWTKL